LKHIYSCRAAIYGIEIVNTPLTPDDRTYEIRYLPPPRKIVINRTEDNKESGIGVYSRGDDHFVGTLVKNSPAYISGLRTGDHLFVINGVLT
ncbi:hypothetical protein PFISCL1PPCAC_8687, partial [Pristionchus fissidentatus]